MNEGKDQEKIPIQNETFETSLNLLTTYFSIQKNEKKNLKVKKYFKWDKGKNQEKIPIQNETFKTSLNLLTLIFPYKKMKKKNLKVKKHFKWIKGKIKRRFQHKMRHSKQVWICPQAYFSIQKKWKKKKFKSEKIFSIRRREKSRKNSNTKWDVPNKFEFAHNLFFHTKKWKKKI